MGQFKLTQFCAQAFIIKFISFELKFRRIVTFHVGTLEFCDALRDLLQIAYLPGIQDRLVQAQYWHDPIQVDLHRRSSQFIGPINNEVRDGQARLLMVNFLQYSESK